MGDLLRAAAAGRQEYAKSISTTETNRVMVRQREDLELQASTLDQAAAIVDGSLEPLYGLLPSWRWTPEMHVALEMQADLGSDTGPRVQAREVELP